MWQSGSEKTWEDIFQSFARMVWRPVAFNSSSGSTFCSCKITKSYWSGVKKKQHYLVIDPLWYHQVCQNNSYWYYDLY